MAGLDGRGSSGEGRSRALKLLRHPAVHWLLALIVGGVFVYASLSKIADPQTFAKIIYHYQVIGPSASLGFVPANLVAVALPWIELVAGVLLMTGVWRREAAVITAVLLAVFVAAVGSTMARGIDIQNCGCFALDASGRAAGWKLIAGDLALLAAAFVVAVVPPRAAEAAVEASPATAT
jgi:putative oxidoreductase